MDWYGYFVGSSGYFPYFANLVYSDSEQDYPAAPPSSRTKMPRRVLTKEQLKSKKAAPFRMPKDFKETYKRVVTALKKGDEGILSPLKETPNHMLVVNQKDLNAPRIHEKVVKLSSMPKEKSMDFLFQKSQHDPHVKARQTFNRNGKIASLRMKVTDLIRGLDGMKKQETQEIPMPQVNVDKSDRNRSPSNLRFGISPKNRKDSPVDVPRKNVSRQPKNLNSKVLSSHRSAARFRDWNPDIKVALKAGISIRYSSRSNEVRCPELNISSRHVSGSKGYRGARVHLTSNGSVTAPGSSSGVYAGGSSSGSSSRGGSSSAKSSSSGGKSSSSGSKGGIIKK